VVPRVTVATGRRARHRPALRRPDSQAFSLQSVRYPAEIGRFG